MFRRKPRLTDADDARLTFRDKLSVSVRELDHARLQDRFAGLDWTPIGEAEGRVPIRVGGEVRSLAMASPHDPPSVRVFISDGSGSAIGVFTGRRRIRGLDPGRGLVLEGVGRWVGERLVLLNPGYTVLP